LREYCTKHHKILVRDLDDDVWAMTPDHPFWAEKAPIDGAWTPIRDSLGDIERSIEAADLVTTTTEVLGERLRQRFPDRTVAVLPNCILPSEWDNLPKHDGLRIGTCGGESHVKDYEVLKDVYPEIHRRFPEATLVAAGYIPDYLADLGYVVHYPSAPTAQYPALEANLGVRLCPLLDTEFNRAKSPIGLIEAAMVGAVPIVSPTVYLVESQRMGLDYWSPIGGADTWDYAIGYILPVGEHRHIQGYRRS